MINLNSIEGRSQVLDNLDKGIKHILSESKPSKPPKPYPNHDVICVADFGIYDSEYHIIDLMSNKCLESRRVPTNRHYQMNLQDQFYYVVEKALKHNTTRFIYTDEPGGYGTALAHILGEEINKLKYDGYFPGNPVHIPELKFMECNVW